MATIGSGKDYATIPAWESAIAANDQTGTCDEAADLGGGSTFSLNAGYTGLLLTVSASYRVSAPTAAEAAASARVEDGVWVWGSGSWTIEYLGFVDCGIYCFSTAAATWKNCVFDGGGVVGYPYDNDGDGTHTLLNCAVFGGTSGQVRIASNSTVNLYHCSLYGGSTTGIGRGNSGVGHCYACIVMTSGTCYNANAGTLDGDENVSEDTSAPGTTYWRSQTNVFANTSSGFEDLSLSAGAQGDYGVSDYSGTYGDLATDIAGTTRTGTIDAGVWQTPAAAATSFVPRTRPAHFVHLRR